MDEIKYKEAISALMKDKSRREELAEIITEWLDPNHLTLDLMSQFLDTRQLNPGDSLVKRIRKGWKVYSFVPGSVSMKSEITVMDRINYMLDGAIIGVKANEWELESGVIGTVDYIRSEALAFLRDFYMNKVFTALTSVWTASNTPNNYTDCGGPLTQAALEDMINWVNQHTSGVKAIVGVRAALTPIMHFGAFWSSTTHMGGTVGWSTEKIEEVMQDGWLGSYMGAPIIALNQVFNNPYDYQPLLPTDKVMVIGHNVGEFITYGPEKYQEYVDNEPTPPYWNLSIYQQFGS